MNILKKSFGLAVAIGCLWVGFCNCAAAEEESQSDASYAEAKAEGGTASARLDDIVVTADRREMLLSDTPEVFQVVTADEIAEMNPASTGEILVFFQSRAKQWPRY